MLVMDNNDDNEDKRNDSSEGEQSGNDLTDGDNENKKKKFRALVPTRKEPFSVRSKENILAFIRKQFAGLSFSNACEVLKVCVNDVRVPHLFIYKTVMYIFRHYFKNDNNRLLQLMRNVAKLDINKRELILDMIIHFLKSNNRIAAKQYIDSNHVYIQYNNYRSHPQIDAYLKAYICYVEYLEWKQLINNEEEYRFNDTAKIMCQKVTLNIKKLICESEDCLLDMLIDIAVEMYDHEKQYEEALNLLRDYVKYNCDHLNAYIYLYEYLKHCRIVSSDDELLALKNIARLCVSHPLVIELAKRQLLPIDENIQLVLEFIDRKENSDNVEAWILLSDMCRNLNQQNSDVQQKVKEIWNEYYSYYMIDLYFTNLNNDDCVDQNKQLLDCKKEILNFFES